MENNPLFVPNTQDYWLQFPENAPRTLTDHVYHKMIDDSSSTSLIIIEYLVERLPLEDKIKLAEIFGLRIAVKTKSVEESGDDGA